MIMKKSIFTFFAITFFLLTSIEANAGRNSGNYINSQGCLVVWTSYTLFGITWSYNETVFCNNDGSPVTFE